MVYFVISTQHKLSYKTFRFDRKVRSLSGHGAKKSRVSSTLSSLEINLFSLNVSKTNKVGIDKGG